MMSNQRVIKREQDIRNECENDRKMIKDESRGRNTDEGRKKKE